MRAAARGLLVAVTLGCSSSPAARDPPAVVDAGQDGARESAACTGNDVFCNGFCQPENLDACGAACVVCRQPATSHADASCFEGTCLFQCNGGYEACGTQSCCGTQGSGDVARLAVGGDTTCGLTTGGALSCWGDGSYGVLADGSLAGRSLLPLPILSLSSGVADVALGAHHVCALHTSGAVSCWGDDEQGQLGDGMNVSTSTPHPPGGLSSSVAIAAGAAHTCAVTTGGGVWCWGANTSGQLGDSSTVATSALPVAVTGLSSGVASVVAGESFTCALTHLGQVQCWGDGSNGQLGGPATSDAPVAIALPATIVAIAAGARHACGLTQAGSVLCWGADDKNQLGSSQGSIHPSPLVVPGVAGASAIAAGGDETCAVASGAVTCWGADPLGDVPSALAGPGVVPSLTASIWSVGVTSGHACAVTVGGAPKCWGGNTNGDLGDGTTVASWVPIDVTGI